MHRRPLLWILLITMIIYISAKRDTEKCKINNETLLCYNVTMEEIYTNLINDIDYLHIKYYRGLNLPKNSFNKPKLSSLVNITIEIGYLEEIGQKSFAGLPELRHLNLAHNNIKLIPFHTFDYIRQLSTLNLMDNSIEIIIPGTFTSLIFLKSLNLEKNKMKIVPNGILPKSGILMKLYLAYNHISIIEERVFEYTKNIIDLDLSQNKLVTIGPNTFYGLINLKVLNLSNSEIRNMDNESFAGLKELKVLDLSNNDIIQLSNEVLHDMHCLVGLNLSGNYNITSATQPFKYLNAVKHVNIPKYVYQQFIVPGFFTGLLAIKKLDLSHHNLNKSGAYYYEGMQNLLLLNLSYNNITNFPENSFATLTNLEELDLRGNPIKSLADRVFATLENLLNLHLPKFPIYKIATETFQGLVNLLTLDIARCSIAVIHVNKVTYDDCPKQLKILDISYNELEYFIYPYRTPLIELNLSHNKLISIKPSISFNTLQILNISNNQLETLGGYVGKLIKLKVIDIRHNLFYGDRIFHSLSKNDDLRILYIQDNLWTCDILLEIILPLKARDIVFKTQENYVSEDMDNVDGIECLMEDENTPDEGIWANNTDVFATNQTITVSTDKTGLAMQDEKKYAINSTTPLKIEATLQKITPTDHSESNRKAPIDTAISTTSNQFTASSDINKSTEIPIPSGFNQSIDVGRHYNGANVRGPMVSGETYHAWLSPYYGDEHQEIKTVSSDQPFIDPGDDLPNEIHTFPESVDDEYAGQVENCSNRINVSINEVSNCSFTANTTTPAVQKFVSVESQITEVDITTLAAPINTQARAATMPDIGRLSNTVLFLVFLPPIISLYLY